MPDDFCNLTVPMAKWIKQTNQKICRACVLPIDATWYLDELEQMKETEKALKLKKLLDDPKITPERLAKELDDIKASVKDFKLKDRLKEFDCTLQINEPKQE